MFEMAALYPKEAFQKWRSSHQNKQKNTGYLQKYIDEILSQSLRKKCRYSELFWSVFSRVRSEISLRIQSEFGKMQTRITSNTDTFHAVSSMKILGMGDCKTKLKQSVMKLKASREVLDS